MGRSEVTSRRTPWTPAARARAAASTANGGPAGASIAQDAVPIVDVISSAPGVPAAALTVVRCAVATPSARPSL